MKSATPTPPTTMTKTEIIARLKRVWAKILAQPKKYDQGEFCGTTRCITGHLIEDHTGKPLTEFKSEAYKEGFAGAGLEALGNPSPDRYSPVLSWLFSPSFGNRIPRTGHYVYEGEIYPKAAPLDAARAIDLYISELPKGRWKGGRA